MLKSFRNAFALFAGLALVACATQSARTPSAEARPALWTLSDADTNIYLFGTIHALPEGTEWRTPALDLALAASEELVTEIKLEGNEAAAISAFTRLGLATGLPPALERVPEAKREALREAIATIGLPMAAADRMKTWALAVTAAQVLFQRAGLNPELGVERILIADFARRQRPTSGLETVEEQLGFFDSLPEASQRMFLEGVLETPAEVRRELDGMLAAWRSGDTDAIARTFNDEETLSRELREILLTRRNARWAEWLQRRLERPGTIFVAVGAGHLAGDDSVQAMLRRRGLTARRVQ
ncbi:MAG TPA: TraB/GumN family protein [Allosphingosinicella sp.]|nr:TraB/GumN family protein [Allosphingosinicella sp.]